MRLTQILAAAAIALVSTFAFADDAAEQTIRKSLAKPDATRTVVDICLEVAHG